VNFNELRIFESALGQHNMITILEKGSRDVEAIFNIVTESGLIKHQDLDPILHKSLDDSGIFAYTQEDVFDGPEAYIRFPTSDLDSILNLMASSKKRLVDVCIINAGLVSGADRFSNSHAAKFPQIKAEKGEGIFQVSLTEAESFPHENHLKPFFKNSDVSKWFVNEVPRSMVLYLQRDDAPTKYELHHLQKFRPILDIRRGVNTESFPWWALYWPRKMEMFLGVKLVCPQRSSYNKFAYCDSEWFSSADVYYITSKTDRTPLKAILALLNSRLYFAWLYNRGKRKGEALELYQVPLSEIPIPEMTSSQIQAASELVELTIKAARAGNSSLQEKLEKDLDSLVYSIFALSPEQIEAIEVFWTQKRSKFESDLVDDFDVQNSEFEQD